MFHTVRLARLHRFISPSSVEQRHEPILWYFFIPWTASEFKSTTAIKIIASLYTFFHLCLSLPQAADTNLVPRIVRLPTPLGWQRNPQKPWGQDCHVKLYVSHDLYFPDVCVVRYITQYSSVRRALLLPFSLEDLLLIRFSVPVIIFEYDCKKRLNCLS